MKKKSQPNPFSLPILLSFNELAWILIFGMGIYCAHTLLPIKKKGGDGAAIINPPPNTTSNLLITLQKERANSKKLTAERDEFCRQWQMVTNLLHERDEKIRRLSDDLASLQRKTELLLKETNQLREDMNDIARLLSKEHARNLTLAEEKHKLRADLDEMAMKLAKEQAHNLKLEQRLLLCTNLPPDSVVRQELLGLKGGMTNVVILLDRSGSMTTGDRWEDALAVINAWLQYLPIKRCALITFSDAYTAYPPTGLLAIAGSKDDASRNKLIAQVKSLKPEGNTDTLSALKKAYSYGGDDQIDTIILFTDGAPYLPPSGALSHSNRETAGKIRYSKGQMDAVLALAHARSGIPINVVAIGNYYEESELTKFLIKLAKETKGAFLGR